HGVSRPAVVAAGRGGQRRCFGRSVPSDRIALACVGRGSCRDPACGPDAGSRGGGRDSVTETIWIILAGGFATYLTRIGGHLVLSRFERIHPRVEAGLNAVPAAVLTTLVAPAAATAGPAELLALVVAALVSLRAGLLAIFLIGAVVLIAARQFMG